MMLPDLKASRSRSARHRCIVGKVVLDGPVALLVESVVLMLLVLPLLLLLRLWAAEFTAVLLERKQIKGQSSRQMMTQLSKRRHRLLGTWEASTLSGSDVKMKAKGKNLNLR